MNEYRPMIQAITKELPNTDLRGRRGRENSTPQEGVLVEYQPGNATRYDVFFQPLSNAVSSSMGHGFGATLVVFCNMKNQPTLVVPKYCGHLSLSYFMEKTGIQEGDARALVLLVSHRLEIGKRETTTPKGNRHELGRVQPKLL